MHISGAHASLPANFKPRQAASFASSLASTPLGRPPSSADQAPFLSPGQNHAAALSDTLTQPAVLAKGLVQTVADIVGGLPSARYSIPLAPQPPIGQSLEPKNPAAQSTPTIGQFATALNQEYFTTGAPAGMTRLYYNGQPMRLNDKKSGAQGDAWITPQNQVIVAYSGTTGGIHMLTSPDALASQVRADVQMLQGQTPQNFTDSLNFTKMALTAAGQHGISPQNVFVVGHSLGATAAEYISAKTGLGGVAFDPIGIPPVNNALGDGANFVNILRYGDIASNYTNKSPVENNFTMFGLNPATSDLSNFGHVVWVGNPSDGNNLSHIGQVYHLPVFGLPLAAAQGVASIANYHVPGMILQSLGVQASNYDPLVDFTFKTSPNIAASENTIPQFLQNARANGMAES